MKPKYLLDTNIIIYAINDRSESVLIRMAQYQPGEICISAVTLAELEYGVHKSIKKAQNQLALTTFLSQIKVLPFDGKAAMEYGKIRADLEKTGSPIGANDLLIAAHALGSKLILVTNNVKEFNRVKGLKIENWAK